MPMSFAETNPVRARGYRPYHGGDQAVGAVSVAGGNSVLYSVGSGDILYLCSAYCSLSSTVAGKQAYAVVRDGGTNFKYVLLMANDPVELPSPITHVFNPPLELIEGWDIYAETDDAGMRLWLSIFGWLE